MHTSVHIGDGLGPRQSPQLFKLRLLRLTCSLPITDIDTTQPLRRQPLTTGKAPQSKLPQWEYGHGVESLAVIDRGTESKAPGSQNLKSNTVWTLVQRVYTSRGHMEVGSLRVWLSGR